MSEGISKLSYPDRKISEALLHFASPFLAHLKANEVPRRVEETLRVAVTVWNAVVFADVRGEGAYLDGIRHLMAGKPELTWIVQEMINRKRELFVGDDRLIGAWEVTRTEDGFNVRAEARDPHILPRSGE